jgi:hypothetical protein
MTVSAPETLSRREGPGDPEGFLSGEKFTETILVGAAPSMA